MMDTAPCPVDQRFARGYCPDETEGHIAELCSLGIEVDGSECDQYNHADEICTEEFNDAPFCAGDSEQSSWRNPCEDDGSCDDSFTDVCVEQGLSFDYTTGECVSVDHESYVVDTTTETLPETGIGTMFILPFALAALVLGFHMIRFKP